MRAYKCTHAPYTLHFSAVKTPRKAFVGSVHVDLHPAETFLETRFSRNNLLR